MWLRELKQQFALGVPRERGFALGLVVSGLQAACAVALMAVSAWLISRAAQQPPVLYLQIAVVLVRGFALGRASFRYLERILLHNSAFKMLGTLRPKVFAALIPLAPAGLTTMNRGQTVSRLVTDVDEIQNFALRVLSPLVQSLTVAVLSVVFFAVVSPGSAVVLLLCLLAAFVIAIPISTGLAAAANGTNNSYRRKLAGDTLDLLENLAVLEAYGWSAAMRARIGRSEASLLRIANRQATSAGVGQALLSLLATVATFGSAVLGAQAVESGALPGVMLAALALVPMAVFDVISASQAVLLSWQRYQESAANLLDLMNTKPDSTILVTDGTQQLPKFKNLALKNVTASYPGALSPAIDGFELTLSRGETVLLQGPSGGGKSTVANVLLRFLEPTAGQYLINGKSVQGFMADDIRAAVGYIEQRPTIFLGTLRANLLIGNPQATDAQLWRVLERVSLRETFEAREGLDTQLGERGTAVSGGEAQRIALARALLADFSVLIFDEPTSNVDPLVADALLEDLLAIAKANKNRAVLLISHLPQHETLVDRVVRL